VIDLGWEPQWLIVKRATGGSFDDWWLFDDMRGISTSYLFPNLSSAEGSSNVVDLNATGFQPVITSGALNASGSTYIYIAIRRGPMKTPTSGAEVFASIATANSAANAIQTTNFPVDFVFAKNKSSTLPPTVGTRLLGGSYFLTSGTSAETSWPYIFFDSNIGYYISTSGTYFNTNAVNHSFRRAPGFFDVVAYAGGSPYIISHNLGAVPELILVKSRSASENWAVYAGDPNSYLVLNSDAAESTTAASLYWSNTAPTSSTFTCGAAGATGGPGYNYIAYLFATVPGVSKVGSYTGTGTTLQVDCGFASGARFVLIKRTDSTGDWYVWDTARGIVSGLDPYLLLNSSAAEVTSTDYVDPYSAGFEINSTAPAAINASGGSFIYLAIA